MQSIPCGEICTALSGALSVSTTKKASVIMTRLSRLNSSRQLSGATGMAKSAGNTIMPRSVLPENLKCSMQQEPSHGSAQKDIQVPAQRGVQPPAGCLPLSRDFHENTKWDFAWAVRRYLSFFQEKGIPSLDRASINDSREFVIGAAASMAAGSLHNLLCYVRQFHIFLKDSGEKAPDCISLFSYHVPRKMPVRGYVSDEELTAIIGQVDTSTSMGKRDKGIIMLGATTGLRAVDIARLKLTDIDWIRGEIHVMQSKTGGMFISMSST